MVDPEVFGRRLAKLEEVLKDLRVLSLQPRQTFLESHALQAQAERWLHLAAECVLDLAHHMVAERGWGAPATNRATFQLLEQHGVLTPELSAQLQGWAGLRNLLVHLYLEVNYERLWEILTEELDQLESFVAALVQFVGEEP